MSINQVLYIFIIFFQRLIDETSSYLQCGASTVKDASSRSVDGPPDGRIACAPVLNGVPTAAFIDEVIQGPSIPR